GQLMDGSPSYVTNDKALVKNPAEGEPFDRKELNALLDLAAGGCADLEALQLGALELQAP
ncbi:hypothetical protein AB0D15_28920, partial [Streptomyces sp. NPDC048551]